MVMEILEGGDLYTAIHDPLKLREPVFNFLDKFGKECCSYLGLLSLYQQQTVRHAILSGAELPPEVRVELDQYGSFQDIQQAVQIKQQLSPSIEAVLRRKKSDFPDIFPPPPPVVLEEKAEWQECQAALRKWRQRNPSSIDYIPMVRNAATLLQNATVMVKETEEVYKEDISAIHQQYQDDCKGFFPVVEDWSLRMKVATDIARGLLYLHELEPPFVHRDIKTPNILLANDLEEFDRFNGAFSRYVPDGKIPLAKLSDFGLSLRMVSRGAELKVNAGSKLEHINAMWAAPEVLSQIQYSYAADTYSFGIMMYELLTGLDPCPTRLSSDFLSAYIMEGGRPEIPQHLSDDPANARWIALMQQCWAPNPAERPSMRDVYLDLRVIAHSAAPDLFATLPDMERLTTAKKNTSKEGECWKITKTEKIPPVLPITGPPDRQDTVGFSSSITNFFRRPQFSSVLLSPLARRMQPCEPECLPQQSSEEIYQLPASYRPCCFVGSSDAENLSTTWIGFTNGAVCYGRHLNSQLQLQFPRVHHLKKVTCLRLGGNDEMSDMVWSSSEAGSLHVHQLVWREEIMETFRFGDFALWMAGKSQGSKRVWLQIETGRLRWFENRTHGCELGSVAINSKQIKEIQYTEECLEVKLVKGIAGLSFTREMGATNMDKWGG
jgi:serine/threonine protein kinase